MLARMPEHILEFAAASSTVPDLRGSTLHDGRDRDDLPFKSLTTFVTDDLSAIEDDADVGLYVVLRRVIKPGTANVFGLFPLVHHPDKTHAECDAHWRDTHAPLALVHHAHMSHYTQLSVVHRIRGMEIDGFALCGFDSEEDLRERFYTTPESRDVIVDDVRKFADTKRSPRRLIAQLAD